MCADRSDAGRILEILQSHSTHHLEILGGYVLVAHTLDSNGTLRTHAHTWDGQPADLTNTLADEARRLLLGVE